MPEDHSRPRVTGIRPWRLFLLVGSAVLVSMVAVGGLLTLGYWFAEPDPQKPWAGWVKLALWAAAGFVVLLLFGFLRLGRAVSTLREREDRPR